MDTQIRFAAILKRARDNVLNRVLMWRDWSMLQRNQGLGMIDVYLGHSVSSLRVSCYCQQRKLHKRLTVEMMRGLMMYDDVGASRAETETSYTL
jgi:hypothetical protein